MGELEYSAISDSGLGPVLWASAPQVSTSMGVDTTQIMPEIIEARYCQLTCLVFMMYSFQPNIPATIHDKIL